MNIDQEYVVFLYEHSSAITQWARVESGLRDVLISCFDSKDAEALSLGIFSIENFRSKADFSSRVIGTKIDPQLSNEWINLLDRVRAASTLRNQLVHRHLKLYPKSKEGRRVVLVPWIPDEVKRKSKKKMPPQGSLGLLAVYGSWVTFYVLTLSLANFACRVRGEPEQYSEFDELPKHLPKIQTLLRQIRRELATPRRSSRR